MIDKLTELEGKLWGLSERSLLPEEIIISFPENLKQIYSYKIFGENLLAIPSSLINNDDDDFEKPFSFINSLESIHVFKTEFRPEIPENFIQIGSLYNSTEIVLLNSLKESIHIFNVADIVDRDWLKYKLANEICDLITLINNIQPQTVCCLLNPTNFSQFEIFEIRNTNELKNDNSLIKYPDNETAKKELKKLVEISLDKGYKIHYAPKDLLIEFNK